ncbi:putative hydro-lyase [Orrella daihaiensis]|uniref:Putative hydro-lyase DHf2319_10470 n=1 Tax=Orrella daihaiensis TaxID=2782176 RepID=A0ABY4AHU5_9BURK|nr:putative hydro-lyase [Orrella daihaiensis]UOD49862.1 putative hydro-lyase [Orrella daihaiensis]
MLESEQIRLAARNGTLNQPTTGLAYGFVQANLVILPAADAMDFLVFCQRNPKPCPLLGVSTPGERGIPSLGVNLDIATDIPRYRVWQDGEMVNECADVSHLWRDDLVSFALGCSFSFEEALLEQGLELRHITQGRNVPMYRTNVPTNTAGKFHGPLVVSMRPFKPADAIRAIQITTRFPDVHGSPVHIGDPELIGIKNINQPEYGDAVDIKEGEMPVFWACGVTPQSVLMDSKPKFCITHAPGYMLVTDLKNAQLAVM